MSTSDETVQNGTSATTASTAHAISVPSIDGVETKSQKLKRIPPFLKNIAEIDLGDDKPSVASIPSIEDEPVEASQTETSSKQPQVSDELKQASDATSSDAKNSDAEKNVAGKSVSTSKGLAHAAHTADAVESVDDAVGKYSRYQNRYTDGTIRDELTGKAPFEFRLPSSLADIDPITSWVPYIAYGVAGIVAALVWFIVAMVGSDGSIMANPTTLHAGIVVLVVVLVLGVALIVLMSMWGDKQTGGALRLDTIFTVLGKTTAAMAVFVLVWSVLMAIAA